MTTKWFQTFLMLILLSTGLASHADNKPADSKAFGGPLTIAQTTTLSEAMQSMSKDKSKEMVVEAKVKNVCQKKGCWMEITDDKVAVRMTFKDYKFFVPNVRNRNYIFSL